MSKDASCAEAEKGNRDSEKGKMIEKDDRKEASERQLEQQAGAAHYSDGSQRTIDAHWPGLHFWQIGNDRFLHTSQFNRCDDFQSSRITNAIAV